MKLIQTLEVPVNGYWNGGAKSVFEWTISGPPRTDAKGQYVRIGSFEANHWFHVALGATERDTLLKAKRYLKRKTNAKCTFKLID